MKNFLPLEGWRKFKEFLTGWLHKGRPTSIRVSRCNRDVSRINERKHKTCFHQTSRYAFLQKLLEVTAFRRRILDNKKREPVTGSRFGL